MYMKEMKIKQNSVFSNLKIGCPFESLFLEKKTTLYPMVLNVLLYICDAKKGCKVIINFIGSRIP